MPTLTKPSDFDMTKNGEFEHLLSYKNYKKNFYITIKKDSYQDQIEMAHKIEPSLQVHQLLQRIYFDTQASLS